MSYRAQRFDEAFDELDTFSAQLGRPLVSESSTGRRMIVPVTNLGLSEHPV